MGELVHVSIDSVAGEHYGFASVDEQLLESQLAREDRDELSLLIIENAAGGCLVLPWSTLLRVCARRDQETTWQVRWRRPKSWGSVDRAVKRPRFMRK